MLWKKKRCADTECEFEPSGIADIIPATSEERKLIAAIRDVRRQQDRVIREIHTHIPRLRAAKS